MPILFARRDGTTYSRPERAEPEQIAQAMMRLAQARQRLRHLPTPGQVQAMASLDGHEPCSYLLDRRHNLVPRRFPYKRELGRHALCFTIRDENGWFVTEMVAMCDGTMFDLLARGR